MEDSKTFTTRPVLDMDDLSFINEGLGIVLTDIGKQAKKQAKAGDTDSAGETLAVGVQCEELLGRMQGLQSSLIQQYVESRVTASECEAEEDEVGTVPMSEYEEIEPQEPEE